MCQVYTENAGLCPELCHASPTKFSTAQTPRLAPTISRPGHLRSEPLVLRIPGAFRDNLCGVALAKYLDFHLAAFGGEVRV